MPHFIDLTPEKRGVVLRNLLSKKEKLEDGRHVTNIDGTSEDVDEFPTQENFDKFKLFLINSGLMDPYLRQSVLPQITNEMLGGYAVNRALTIPYSKSSIISEIGSGLEAKRKLGFTQAEMKLDIQNQAISHPVQFLKDKTLDIKNINERAYNTYKEAYDKFRTFGYSDEEAFEKAKVAANAFKNELLKVHEKEYPPLLEKDARSRIGQNVI